MLRAVLRQVSPMVIRLISVSDQLQLPDFHDIFRATLGWCGDLGYIIRIHRQEFNSFRRKTRMKALHEFKLHRQEKFLYICDTLLEINAESEKRPVNGRLQAEGSLGYRVTDLEMQQCITKAQAEVFGESPVELGIRSVRHIGLDLSPFLRQEVKTQNPSNGELSHGIVSQAVH
jgi:hypothetical protein